MNDRDRLVKLLDTNFGYVDEQKADDLADFLIANGVAVPRWISVEERLPEDCKHVLVFMRRNVVPGWSVDYWHIDTDWLDDGNWSKNPTGGYFNITHWMPLPEPPKEE